MTPDAIEACARSIERLEAEVRRWREAYGRLASNRKLWIDASLRTERPVTRQRVAGKIKARLREW